MYLSSQVIPRTPTFVPFCYAIRRSLQYYLCYVWDCSGLYIIQVYDIVKNAGLVEVDVRGFVVFPGETRNKFRR